MTPSQAEQTVPFPPAGHSGPQTRLHRMGERLSDNTGAQFWICQAAGWAGLTLLSYLSLALWYNPIQWVFFNHTVLQSALGLLISLPLRHVARYAWQRPLGIRILINLAGILAAALVWTALRIQTFEWMTHIDIQFSDYGGWVNLSILVFTSWVICYHGMRYYRQMLQQKEIALHAQKVALEACNRIQDETLKRLQAESLTRETQLRMLRYQINPHFLFNTLNSITALVKTRRHADAEETIAKMADFLRITLHHDDELEHELAKEVEVTNLYLAIEQVRFEERLKVSFDIADDARGAIVPSLLLQPLFENTVKHAVSKTLEPIAIHFSARRHGDNLQITITDTGPGMNRRADEADDGIHGIGLSNIRRRLEARYGEDFDLQFQDNLPHGLTVSITIPFGPAP